jgi:hypothetical protein
MKFNVTIDRDEDGVWIIESSVFLVALVREQQKTRL